MSKTPVTLSPWQTFQKNNAHTQTRTHTVCYWRELLEASDSVVPAVKKWKQCLIMHAMSSPLPVYSSLEVFNVCQWTVERPSTRHTFQLNFLFTWCLLLSSLSLGTLPKARIRHAPPPLPQTSNSGKGENKQKRFTITGNNLEQDQAHLGLTTPLMQRRRETKPNEILSLWLFGLVKTSWPLPDQRPAKGVWHQRCPTSGLWHQTPV